MSKTVTKFDLFLITLTFIFGLLSVGAYFMRIWELSKSFIIIAEILIIVWFLYDFLRRVKKKNGDC
jgi:hypothetical protein